MKYVSFHFEIFGLRTFINPTIFLFLVAKIISYNKYIGPYGAEKSGQNKLWNQNNETCKFQHEKYGELCKDVLAKVALLAFAKQIQQISYRLICCFDVIWKTDHAFF